MCIHLCLLVYEYFINVCVWICVDVYYYSTCIHQYVIRHQFLTIFCISKSNIMAMSISSNPSRA